MKVSIVLSMATAAFGLSSSVHKRQPPANPLSEPYVTARPACNITGFTEVPGNYTEFIYQESGATLEECMDACRANDTCLSIAYSAEYDDCLFYNQYCNGIQLFVDNSSFFDHFDNDCDVCEYDESD